HIELLQQDYNTAGAFIAAAILTLIAIATLVVKAFLQWKLARETT
ncbi:MAG: sulfate/thiosulfate ABC transporter permease CysW, partial [Alkalimonas sp.]|nr:sulfate/thiosulfate ABC transporter permease CysW [Alkalimonas sp.]